MSTRRVSRSHLAVGLFALALVALVFGAAAPKAQAASPGPSITINDPVATESSCTGVNAVFTVQLSRQSQQVVSVHFATANGSAMAPNDYQSASGTLTFQPRERTKSILVPILSDQITEGPENFVIILSTPTNGTITDAQGFGRILNDQCDDADSCTTDSCNPATLACQNTEVSCDDNNVCTSDTCNPSGGCQHQAIDLGQTTCGTGACEHTVQTCVNGVPQTCTPGTPTAEVCNGQDDDCNGAVDGPGSEASCQLANATATCSGGACAIATCNVGYDNCDGHDTNGCEINVATDPNNCSACNITCTAPAGASATCTGGVCGFTCNTGYTDCGGSCLNLNSDPNHCGTCTTVCAQVPNASATCTAGACTAACNSGFGDCNGIFADGCENDLSAVPNCGSCGVSCDDGSACTNDICLARACVYVDKSRCNPVCDSIPGCANPDTDGDGLSDVWETALPDAGAIDLDCDGDYDSNDVVIPNANPLVADIYIKASAMYSSTESSYQSHVPTEAAVRNVVAMFGGSHLKTTPHRCDASTPCPSVDETGSSLDCSLKDFVCVPTCSVDTDCAASTDGGRCVDGLCRRRTLHFNYAEINLLGCSSNPCGFQELSWHKKVITYGPVNPACITGGDTAQGVNFYDLKADPMNFDPKTGLFTHYGVFGHFQSCDSLATCGTFDQPDGCTGLDGSVPDFRDSGLAEIIGNDWVVALGAFGYLPTWTTATKLAVKDRRDAGAFAHELGHNLGLRHGGPDCRTLQAGEACDYDPDQDRKPNYLSIMNYAYQFGIPTTTVPGETALSTVEALDYSRGVLRTLDEIDLDEYAGVSPGLPYPWDTYLVKFWTPTTGTTYGSTTPGVGIDWNSNGSLETSVSVDIDNSLDPTVHKGAEDWSHLFYAFQCSTTYEN